MTMMLWRSNQSVRRPSLWSTRAACAPRSSSAVLPDRRLPSEAYGRLVAEGRLATDDKQWRVARRYLDKLHGQLTSYRLPDWDHVGRSESLSTPGAGGPGSAATTAAEPPVVRVPRGLYLHGHVGTGKSMLMDLFFEHAPLSRKRRVHFNKFMLEVHARLQDVKQRQLARFGRQRNIDLDPSRDAISIVAEELVAESHLLCFDEFQVTDIADAMIMRKLFGVFFGNGGVMVATSNTAPQVLKLAIFAFDILEGCTSRLNTIGDRGQDLYKDGTNYEYFRPFLQQLARHTKVVDIDSVIDYRTLAEPQAQRCFFHPLTEQTSETLDEIFEDLVGDERVEELSVPVMMGRQLTVRGSTSGVARVSFNELCNTEKGAADYKALAECFHTVVLKGVPLLEMKAHDQARRFILLIDELYEHRTRLICSAAVAPSEIFQFDDAPLEGQAAALAESELLRQQQLEESEKQGIPPASSWDSPVGTFNPAKMAGLQVQNLCSLQDLKVAFKRAVSRMTEMQSASYLEANAAMKGIRQQQFERARRV